MRGPFRLHGEAKGHTGRSVENFQQVIATSTTIFACRGMLIRQLKAAIAGIAFGTRDVGYLHLSLGFCCSFPGDEHPTEKSRRLQLGRFGAIVPVTFFLETLLREFVFGGLVARHESNLFQTRHVVTHPDAMRTPRSRSRTAIPAAMLPF
jgi:hypothetical protein